MDQSWIQGRDHPNICLNISIYMRNTRPLMFQICRISQNSGEN